MESIKLLTKSNAYISSVEVLKYVISYEINTVDFFVVECWLHIHAITLPTWVYNAWFVFELVGHKDIFA